MNHGYDDKPVYTKESLKTSILNFAKEFKLEDGYKALMNQNRTLPEMVKDIIQDMFIYKYNPYFSTHEHLYDSYQIIFRYATEIREKGFSNFEK